ncbi:ATP-binding protein [Zoogloea sp.]|uniref:ATP-binding protein n=1 Tax=Zoogloea sp. TaxID=49181 RepID=UPI0026032D10|nr:ATP-binding protein [uncultured Zoogloea sp.]
MTVAIAMMAWFSFQQVVSTQSNIVDRVMPAMDTVRRLASHDARITALVDQLPRVDSRQEAEQIRGLLDEQLQDMAAALARLDAQGFDPRLGASMRTTVAAITDNLRQQTALTLRRLDTEEAERTAVMRRRESLKALVGLSESLVANASTTTTANIANLYRLIDGGSKPPRLFEALDRLIEVDIDGMERMAQFQLLCFKLQTLLAQVESQTNPEGVDQINRAFAAGLTPLKRRIDDLRDPSQLALSLAHYRSLAGDDVDNPFRIHRQRLETLQALAELRTRGRQLGVELNQQAGELVSTGSKALDTAGAQARRAVDRGLITFVVVAGLLFFALIVTVWAVFRYHLLGRLSGMETAVRALSTGNYDVTIATGDQDPLAPLGRALEQFRENARERLRLEDELLRHQQVLESQVAERTAELEHSNALLAREVAEHAVARQVAEEADKAKSVFLGTLSHELRTPLSGVLGTVRLLRESPLDSRQREYLDMIGYANLTLLEILEDMLSFSRIEAGKLDLQREPFDLRETIDDMLSLQSVQARAKGIALIRDVDADVPRLVVGDRRKLNQLLLNIIGNAIKFTDEGSVTVGVSARPADTAAARLCFSVCDTGIGIPADKATDVFKPFFQVEETAHRRHGGAGLGLAICQRLVTAMGGQITLESEAGEGTCVRFSLDFEIADHLPAPADDEHAAPVAQRPLKVLVVEDDEINRLVCTRYLELLGHHPLAAGDGTEAIRLLQGPGAEVDVILMDISLPGRSGLEVAEEIRALDDGRWAGVPLIVMSAHVSPQAAASRAAAASSAFMSKPFSLNTLARNLNAALSPADAPPDEVAGAASSALLDPAFVAAEIDTLGAGTMSELLQLFSGELPAAFAELHAAHQAQDWAALGKRAHRLRSAASNLGMSKVMATTRAIEAAAGAVPAGGEGIDAALRQLAGDCRASCDALQRELLAAAGRQAEGG